MNAVNFRTSRLAFRLAVASVASVCALQSGGCSGTVITSHESPAPDGGIDPHPLGNGGVGAGGASGRGRSGGGVVVGGKSGSGSTVCGNGVIDPGEECDGANLNNENCYSATMGALPNGQLSCSGCVFDLSGCFGTTGGRGGSAGIIGFPGGSAGAAGSAGYAGYGGFGGYAGAAGAAGSGGTMGVDPASVCYAGSGVPEPGNPYNCLTGGAATSACIGNYVANRFSSVEPIDNPTCAAGCGCVGCASQYDKCATASDCIYILECVERTKCARMVDCYQPSTCQNVIDAVGGPRTRPAIDVSNLLPCMMGAGCAVSCG